MYVDLAVRRAGRSEVLDLDLDLDLAELGPLGERLGGGGEGRVYAVDRLRLSDVSGPMVFKHYGTPRPRDVALTSLIDARRRLDEAGRRRLDAGTTWPVRRVVDHGVVVGLVMRRIPEAFRIDLVLPGSGRATRNPHDLQTLMIDPGLAARLGRPYASREDRLRVARDVASTMAFLHRAMNVVVGDVSPRNTLIHLGGAPSALIVDCDGMRTAHDAIVTRAVHTPDWAPPEAGPPRRESQPTTSADVYKLGLLILRALVPRAGGSTDRDPQSASGLLSDTGLSLLKASLGPDPSRRPGAHDWFVHLSSELGEPVRPPRLEHAAAEPSLVVPGATVRVRWVLRDPARLEVRAHGAVMDAFDAPAGPGSVDVTPTGTGPLELVATNPFGDHRLATRPVFVLEPPATATLPVPVPGLELPSTSATALPVMPLPALPGLPDLVPPASLVAAPFGSLFPPAPVIDLPVLADHSTQSAPSSEGAHR